MGFQLIKLATNFHFVTLVTLTGYVGWARHVQKLVEIGDSAS